MKTLRAAAASAAALLLVSCSEPPQEAGKTYAGKEDAKAYSGDAFKGDKKKWEASLATRADSQNEYIRTGAANKK